MSEAENDLEAAIRLIWAQCIGEEALGCEDNFFDLGGHSLIAIEIAVRIQRALGLPCTMSDISSFPTVRSLSNAIIRTLTAPQTSGLEDRPGERAVP